VKRYVTSKKNWTFPQIERRATFNPKFREKVPVTVCIAALCRWNYVPKGKKDDWGKVAITASDRMITFGDVQYEPNQTKVAQMTKKTALLIAGDYALHSEAIRNTVRDIGGREDVTPRDVALMYGRAIQNIKRRHAEDMYLAPLGLNTDLLMAQQTEMSDSLVSALVSQMQEYRGDEVEALIVGMEDGRATIYHVDSRGTATCADDVGFAAIGAGAWHARSALMQSRYTNNFFYYPALAAVYAAKKAADISPGVGSTTDIHIAFREQTERLLPRTYDKLAELYDKYIVDREKLSQEAVSSLLNFIIKQGSTTDEQGKTQPAGGDAPTNESANDPTSETPRGNEAGEEGESDHTEE
jgi:20S proteasome alpha/beta subunit